MFSIMRQRTRITIATASVLVVLAAILALSLADSASGDAKGAQEEATRDMVKAREFVVVDSTGRKRAEFGMTKSGQVRLAVYGPKVTPMLWAGVDTSGLPSFTIVNSAEEPIAELGMVKDDEPFMVLRDKSGVPRLGAKFAGSAGAAVSLFHSDGSVRARLAVDKKGLPHVVLSDRDGTRIVIAVHEDGQCAVDLLDSEQRMRVGVFSFAEADGTAAVAVLSQKGNMVASVPSEGIKALNRKWDRGQAERKDD